CAQGHPIALEAMQLAGGDAFGAQQRPAQQPYGAPPQQPANPMPPTGGMSAFPGQAAPAQAPVPAAQAPAPPQQPPPPPAPISAPAAGSSPSTADTSPQKASGGRRQLTGFLVSFHN